MNTKETLILKKKNLEDLDYKRKDNKASETEKRNRLAKIRENFSKYKTRVSLITALYVICYLAWTGLSAILAMFLVSLQYQKDGNFVHPQTREKASTNVAILFLVKLIHFIFIGFLFSLDGIVSGLVKNPFGQLNYEINHAASSKILTEEQKEDLTLQATMANEFVRETFKKFGVLALSTEASRLTMFGESVTEGASRRDGAFWWLFPISYAIPILLCCYSLIEFQKSLRAIEVGEQKIRIIKKNS